MRSDLSREDPKCIERYGKPDPEWRADGAPKMTTNFLLARRLVEAGAHYVSLNFSRWDWHSGNFKRGREDMPLLDHALSSLVDDLHERGLDRGVQRGLLWRIRKDSPRSMPREEGIIGPRRTFASWPVEACATVKSLVRPTNKRPNRTTDPSASRKSSPPSFTRWESLRHMTGLSTFKAARTTPSTLRPNPSRSLFRGFPQA